MRILIVDDHEIVREGLRATLSADERFEVVGAVASGHAALDSVRRTSPDVVLLDLRLPDTSGEELCRRLRTFAPSMAVVILSTYLSEETVRGALQAGASAYVTKAAGLSELRAVLERLMKGSAAPDVSEGPQIVKYLHDLVADRMAESLPTPQQERVLELAAHGLTYKEIGKRLYISESTVRFHIQRLKSKLGAHTKTELIAKAIRTGLISAASEDTVSNT
jgi:DNA-binding NarL/FixJ family response regulator